MNTRPTTAPAAQLELPGWTAWCNAMGRLLRQARPLFRAPVAPSLPRALDCSGAAHINNPQGRRITCVSGALWLTFDGERADTVLAAGQSITCDSSAPLLITSFEPSTWRAE